MNVTSTAKALGRGLIVALFILILVRGVLSTYNAVFASAAPVAEQPAAPAAPPVVSEAARAYAVQFARLWLTYDPAHPDANETALEEMASPGAQVVPRREDDSPKVSADTLSVSGAQFAGPDRVLVTVSARTIVADRVSWRELAVPIATSGGLVVDGPPSLVSAAARASVEELDTEGLPPELDGVPDLLDRFFTAYLAGDAAAVADGPAAPEVQLGALAGAPLELGSVQTIRLLPGAPSGEADVIADVRARDSHARSDVDLVYRLRLRKGDRWYVVSINPAKGG